MAGFTYYNCKVHLAGSILNQVMKRNIPAPEVILLQYIHGEDAVQEIERSGEKQPVVDELTAQACGCEQGVEHNDRTMREWLRLRYGNFEDGRDKVNAVFGNSLNPLPRQLALAQDMTAEDKAAAKIERSLRKKIREEERQKILQELEAEKLATTDDVKGIFA